MSTKIHRPEIFKSQTGSDVRYSCHHNSSLLLLLEYESGKAEVQWKNIKECVLDTISDLVGKVVKRARKPWITQEMISKKTDERRKRKNVNTEEGRRN